MLTVWVMAVCNKAEVHRKPLARDYSAVSAKWFTFMHTSRNKWSMDKRGRPKAKKSVVLKTRSALAWVAGIAAKNVPNGEMRVSLQKNNCSMFENGHSFVSQICIGPFGIGITWNGFFSGDHKR